ncbi:MAG: InlB B-repeat-containing protein, partial [Crenarchaeota archaeon]|nr:InlB B-repeat-containing protein [Thermoproteota archaeon]
KTGYTFNGWFTEVMVGTQVTSSTIVSNADDHIIYAQWEIIKIDISYLNYEDEEVLSTQEVDYGSLSVQPADPVREGFTFAGWYTNKTYSQSFVFGNAVTQDTTIYAKFTTIAKLNIEGSEIEEPLTVGNEFEDLENLRQENIDSKPGYTLIGWIYENELVTQETVFNYTDDITITAIFNPNTYTVTFDIDYQGESYPDSIELTYDDIIELLPNPTREGYVFKGWYIGNTKIEEGQIYNISNDSVLTALWEEIGYDYTWVYILSSILFISITLFTIFLIKNIKRKKIYRK